ncbi:MAG: glycosyltransferase family 2 protein [Solirubrobacteraceae bacterium]
MATAPPQASIVIPLTGGPAQALRCFEAIAQLCAIPTHEVIVVDDASIGLDAVLGLLDGDVRVLRSGARVGFGAALRLGVEAALAPTVAVIRDAAVPAGDWLAPLVRALSDPAAGMAASVDPADPGAPVLAAWSVAIRQDALDGIVLDGIDDRLVFGTLALAIAQRGELIVPVNASAIDAPNSRSAAGRRPPGETPELTVVIPTLDATSARVRTCLQALAAATDVAHEVVIVDNGSPPQGFSAPVNAGLRAARTPYVVVMNDDVEVLPGWWEPLRDMIDAGAPVAFPLTIDGAMRTDFAAWCFAIGRDALNEFGYDSGEFFDPSLVVWFQDTDLLMALRRAGRPPVLVRESTIRHGLSQTVATDDPELRAWVATQVAQDERRYHAKQAGIEARAAA